MAHERDSVNAGAELPAIPIIWPPANGSDAQADASPVLRRRRRIFVVPLSEPWWYNYASHETTTKRPKTESKVVRRELQVTKEFLADLESVFETDASNDIPIRNLNDLEEELKKGNEQCAKDLRAELSKLPAAHPVKCPVSLYRVMEMGRLEVAHTHTLAWLLSPNERDHGFGDALLRAFLKQVCGFGHLLSFDVCKVEAERVYRNSLTEDAGRTDIWIEGEPAKSKPWLVVIEAKIDASEGDQQLDRYNREINKWRSRHHDGEVRRVFLTPDGKRATSGQRWKSASFSWLAHVFWDAACSSRQAPGYHFLRYYLAGVLKDILGLPIGNRDIRQNPYKLLKFLTEPNTAI